MKRFVAIIATCIPAIANAWPLPQLPAPDPEPESAPVPAPAPAPAPAPTVPKPDDLAKRVEDLEDRLDKADKQADVSLKLETQLRELKNKIEQMAPRTHSISAYLDAGAFAVAGNGAGIRSDFLHDHYPQYKNQISGQWVFMGDPFTTMVNTLGEPADTADSREIQKDTINSGGHPSIIVNTLALAIGRDFGEHVSMTALAQLLPRAGNDAVDVALAFVSYRPTLDIDNTTLVIEAGKINSVLGVEYRNQDAPDRVGVTPSLICRYTCGRPVGVDARLVSGRLSASAAVTNGDNFDERFEPKDALKASSYPSIAGHLQWTFPLGQGLEVGVSGATGPQDVQSQNHVHQWHYGLDLKLTDLHAWNVVAEYVQGNQQGSTTGSRALDRMNGVERARCDVAPCLNYKGAYVLVDRIIGEKLDPYVRVDWRDGVHHNGATYIYESHSVRATAGVNYRVASRVTAKLEYNFNYEIGVPVFPHDVVTSSVVVSTD